MEVRPLLSKELSSHSAPSTTYQAHVRHLSNAEEVADSELPYVGSWILQQVYACLSCWSRIDSGCDDVYIAPIRFKAYSALSQ